MPSARPETTATPEAGRPDPTGSVVSAEHAAILCQDEAAVTLGPALTRRERKKLETRKALEQAALRLFGEKGYDQTTVEDIAEAADVARRAVGAAEELLGERLDYARVDQMRLADGSLAVSELEVTEPGLYLEVLPANADAFADLVVRRLEGR